MDFFFLRGGGGGFCYIWLDSEIFIRERGDEVVSIFQKLLDIFL